MTETFIDDSTSFLCEEDDCACTSAPADGHKFCATCGHPATIHAVVGQQALEPESDLESDLDPASDGEPGAVVEDEDAPAGCTECDCQGWSGPSSGKFCAVCGHRAAQHGIEQATQLMATAETSVAATMIMEPAIEAAPAAAPVAPVAPVALGRSAFSIGNDAAEAPARSAGTSRGARTVMLAVVALLFASLLAAGTVTGTSAWSQHRQHQIDQLHKKAVASGARADAQARTLQESLAAKDSVAGDISTSNENRKAVGVELRRLPATIARLRDQKQSLQYTLNQASANS